MNEAILTGRLTKAPELRYTSGTQTAVCIFTLAVDRPASKDRGNNGPAADFIRIKTFGKLAENCDRYLEKGQKANVAGRIQTGSYETEDGRRVYTTEVVARTVEFGPKAGSAAGTDGGRRPEDGNEVQATKGNEERYVQSEFDGFYETVSEDEIPF
mgnify:CR=1 FL=1